MLLLTGQSYGEWRYEGQDPEELVQRPSRKISFNRARAMGQLFHGELSSYNRVYSLRMAITGGGSQEQKCPKML